MSAILLLAAISRCASPQLCPSDDDMVAAVRAQDDALAGAVADTAAKTDQIVLVHPQRIRSIRDVICGDRLPGDLPTVTCKMTVRYWTTRSYKVAKMVKSDKWQIVEVLAVERRGD